MCEAGYKGKLTQIWKLKPKRQREGEAVAALELKENQHDQWVFGQVGELLHLE